MERDNIEGYRLSPQQKRLWQLQQRDPGRTYRAEGAILVEGPVDVERLRGALREVVGRHDILRTGCRTLPGLVLPVQVVTADQGSWNVGDSLDGLDPALQASRIESLLGRAEPPPFDMEQGQVLHSTLVALGPERHALVIRLPALCADGVTLKLIARELGRAYAGAGHNGEEPMQYADLSEWQHDMLEGPDSEDERKVWRRFDVSDLVQLRLPGEKTPSTTSGSVSGVHSSVVDEALTKRLDAGAQALGVSGFTLLLAGWIALIARLSGTSHVTVGTVCDGRSYEELEEALGPLSKALPVQARVDPRKSFAALVAEVAESAGEATQWQEYFSWEQLKGANVKTEDAPFFPFGFEYEELGETHGTEVRFSLWRRHVCAERFNVRLLCVRQGSAVRIEMHYDAHRFSEDDVATLAARYVRLIRAALDQPEAPVGRPALIDDAERERLVVASNRTAVAYPSESCFHELFEEAAHRHAQRPAVHYERRTLTYSELNERSDRLARQLQTLGVGADVLVALYLPRSPDLIVGLLGTLKAGGAYLPVDPSYPPERVQYMLEDSGAAVLLTHGELQAGIPVAGARVVLLDGEWDGTVPPASKTSPARPDNLAYVIYTSGSTGRPKGTMIQHGGLVNYLGWAARNYRLEAGDRVPVHSPVGFDLTVTSLLAPLLVGACAELLPEDPGIEPLENALRGSRDLGLVKLTPSHLKALSQRLSPDEASHCARRLVIGGEALRAEHLAFWREHAPETRLINEYGPTETVVGCAVHEVLAGDVLEGAVPIGRPIANTRLYVVDEEMNPVPTGVVGELYIGGAGLARGYLGRPELTAASFVPDPFADEPGRRLYRTGDHCRWRGDRTLEFVGRIDHQVKIRGFRVELDEITSALDDLDEVRACVVLARPGPDGDLRLVAWVVAQDPSSWNPGDLARRLARVLPSSMVPSVFVRLDALPLTPNGKLDTARLPDPETAQQQFRGPYTPASTPVEVELARIWSEVLGVERVGVHDNFFELGGDSILSIQVVSKAGQAGVRLTPQRLFQYQTIAELAAVAETGRSIDAEQGPVTGEVALTPIQHWFFERRLKQPQHYNQSLLLELREPLDAKRLGRAASELVRHHDALRLRYAASENGWTQFSAGVEGLGDSLLEQLDLSNVAAGELATALESAAAKLQSSLDLERGPLFRVALFTTPEGQPDRLLLLAHHLVIDGVSWRILLEDLLTGYAQLERGAAIQLPAKTTSFRYWSERLSRHARGGGADAERAWWQESVERRSAALPLDRTAGPNDVGSAETVEVSLTADETQSLLQEVPSAYRTRINDVLLTALVEALGGWTGSRSSRIDLEGHGREELFEEVDLSRSVGWFTSLYPVYLSLPEAEGVGTSLKSVKEQLRSVPGNGLGYGLLRHLTGDDRMSRGLASSAEVSFNYLGQFGTGLPDDVPVSVARDSAGPAQSASTARPYLLDVNGSVRDGRLRLTWTYSRNLHDRSTVEQLAGRYVEALRLLIEHCLSPSAGGCTPSDFPLAGLGAAALDRLVGRDRDVEDLYPLSPVQAGMLFHSLYAPEAGMYFEQVSCRVSGAIDVEVYRRAWEQSVERHSILRTAFSSDELERPLQVVRRQVRLPFEVLDWRGLEPADQHARFEAYLEQDRRRGFDVAVPPLMRLALIHLGDEAWRIVWSHHHLLLDGWSLAALLKEVMLVYEGAQRNIDVRIERTRPYRDYIGWLQGRDLSAAQDYWKRTLAGLSGPTSVGIDRAIDLAPGEDEHAEQRLELTPDVTLALDQLSRTHQLTLNTIVQGAWAALSCRYSGESDLVYGTTVSGRSAPMTGIASMLGLFINTLPVRTRVEPGRPALEWLGELQQQLAEMREYEATPLTEIHGWSDVPRGVPLFESLLVFENYPIDKSLKQRESSLAIGDVRYHERTNYPLTVIVAPGERLTLRVAYDRRRFADNDVRRLVSHLGTLLCAIAEDPTRPVAALPLLDRPERRQVVKAWNDTATAVDEVCVHEMFEAQVERTPDELAVTFDGRELTYRELNRRANQLAWRLRALGVQPDARVCICMERSPELIVGIIGALKAGAAYVPLDPAYPEERLAFMLEESSAAALVTQQALAAQLGDAGAPVLVLDGDDEELEQSPDHDPPQVTHPDGLAYVLYTSGSTGRPKGVAMPHRGLANLMQWQFARSADLGPPVTLQFASPSFDVSFQEIFSTLGAGGRLVLLREEWRREPERLLQLIADEGVQRVFVPFVALQQLADAASRAGATPSSLRQVITAGEQLQTTVEIATMFADPEAVTLDNQYGPTESHVVTAFQLVGPPSRWDALPSIGRPVANTEIYLLDRWMDPVPVGVAGELYIGGVALARGYLGRANLTAERFVPDPFGQQPGARLYRTGDLCRFSADGTIEFIGRADHQVKIRGFRVELGEIEALVVQLPGVKDAVALVREDVPGNKRLVVYGVPDRDTTLDEREITAHLRRHLPEYMVPAAVVPLETLPLSPNGKVDRKALPAPEGTRPELESPFVEPRTPVEQELARIWSEVLGVERVGVQDNFFELGGHSLLATQLASRVRSAFRVELPLRDVFEASTIAQLAEVVERTQQGVQAPPIERVSRDAELPLSFAQERLWFLDQLSPATAFYNIPAAVRIRGALDVAALEQSFNTIVHRHEALRTTFETVGGRPQQVIAEPYSSSLPLVDLGHLRGAEQEAELRRRLGEEAQRPFDLARGPLLRVQLLRLRPAEHVLSVTFHHIVSDGWSMGVFIREMATLYGRLCAGRPATLPALPVQYADFAHWQREWLSGEVLETQLDYWRERLSGVPVLELPTDRPRPALQTFRGAKHVFELSGELTHALFELSRRHGVTPFMTLLAAYQVLLSRYSGQEDIAVGCPIANRRSAETEALIGVFVNSLVLRSDLTGNPSFAELLDRVRDVALAAYAHQDTPFERLVDELHPERDMSRSPLFQAMFIFQNAPMPSLEQAGLSLTPLEFDDPGVRSDLDLYMSDVAGRLRGSFVYNSDLFDSASVERMSRRYESLLSSLVRDIHTRLSDLELDGALRLPGMSLPAQAPGESPLSYHEERLWFIDEFETGSVYESSPVYHNIPLILHLRGHVNQAELEASLNSLIDRQAVLRTLFVAGEDGSARRRTSPQRLEMQVFDLADSAEPPTLDRAVERALDEARRPFVMDRQLLLRAALLRMDDDESLLVVTVHHILADRSSLRLMARELAEIYSARIEGRTVRLPEDVLEYPVYAQWQRALPSDALEPLLFYWRWQLRGRLRALELPEDRPRPAVHTFTDARTSFDLDAELSCAVEDLARSEGVEVFEVLLSGFKVLLQRYARQDEIVVGTSMPCRSQPGATAAVGPFANLLVLRSDLGGNPTFRSLLSRVGRTVRDARTHQEMPFDKLVQHLNPEKDMSRTALFDVLFELDDGDVSSLRLADVRARTVETGLGYGKYDLNLSLRPGPRGLSGTLVYNADIYDRFTIEQMLRHLRVLLTALTGDPDRGIDDVALLDETEQHRQLALWNQTQASWPESKTIHQLFEEQVQRTPANTAVVHGDEQISYRELDERANRLAQHLRSQGVVPDTLVAVCLERSLDLIVALLAVLKAGAAYLPLDPGYPEERLRFMVQDSGASYLVTTRALRQHVTVEIPSTILLDVHQREIAQQPRTQPDHGAAAHHLAYCLYTSGSTGKPKGVLLEHSNVTRLMVNDRLPFTFTPDDVWTLFHSYCFDFSVWEMYGALLYGAKLVIVPAEVAKDPSAFLDLLIRERVTVLNQTPTSFHNVAKQALVRSAPQLALRYVIFGGEALHPVQLAEWRNAYPAVELINMYGITETTVHVTFKAIQAPDIEANVSNIGRPIPTTTTYVMDSGLRLLPVGVPGEVCVGGLGVGRGYLDRDELTREKFVPNPYEPDERLYRSGDLAKLLPSGEMVYLGRIDDQVQIRGFRVELGEIRSRLLEHPAVAKAEVVARPMQADAVEPVAYVVPAAQVSVTALREHLAETLPHYMVPSAFVMLKALPLTSSGKVDRRGLPAPTRERPALESTFAPPRNPLEERLAGIWAEVLGVERVGIHDSFFELGGHSLLATQLVSRVRESFQVELALRSLFENPTVARVAEVIQTTDRRGRPQGPPIEPTTRDGELPLSFAQQRLWFLDQLLPGTSSYNMPTAVRLKGSLDLPVLTRTLEAIVARHESLRTTFDTVDGRPVQKIAAAAEIDLPLDDLSGLDPDEREAELRRRVDEEAQRPFDLARGPLMRVQLLRLGQDEHVLLATLHHIIFDGWSFGVLLREFGAIHAAFSADRPCPLPELPVQYADFAHWQREWLQGSVLEGQLAYWRGQLADLPFVQLPTDRPRPAVQTFNGRTVSFGLEPDLSRGVRELSEREGATPFMTYLAAFQLLLARYTGQDDVVVGSPIANRNRAETEDLIGFFVNNLVLRTDVSGNPTFHELLGRVREVALEAYAHQDVPYEKLVEELRPQRSLSREPLFQIMFGLQNAPVPELQLPGGLSLSPMQPETHESKFDLTFMLWEREDGPTVSIEYNTDLFDAATIERLVQHYRILLDAILADPARPVSETSLLDGLERQRLLVEWNQTDADYTRNTCIHTLFESQVEQRPEAAALEYEGREWTYRELDRRANQLAQHLQLAGVGPEVIVGLCLERSPEMIVGLLGVLKAGGAYLPLDPEYPEDRLAFMLEDSGAAILLTQQRLLSSLPVHGAKPICMDSDWETIAGQSSEAPASAVGSDNLAYVIYTSGSTGRPKGTQLSHEGLCNLTEFQRKIFGAGRGSRILQFAALSYDASVWETFMALANGATLGLASAERMMPGPDLVRLLREQRSTILTLPPSILAVLPPEELGELETIVVAGEKCPADLVARWSAGRRFFNAYGPTETTVCATIERCDGLAAGDPPIGKPIDNTRVYVLDAELNPVPVGVAGELFIGGVGLARGYLDRPALTAERFVPDPISGQSGARLYKTGDLCRWRADGTVEFLGRLDHQVKVRGFRIELGEIEAALAVDASVRQCLVMLRGHGDDRRLVAYVLSEPGHRPDVPVLREALSRRLPGFMVPQAFVVLDEFPLSPSGKVDRNALPDPRERQLVAAEYVEPRTPTERKLAEIWAEVLDLERVGVEDDFFELGGHSLMATRLASRIRAAFEVELPLRSLFENSTVAGLARAIDAAERAPRAEAILPVDRDGQLSLSFAQERLWFFDQLVPANSFYNMPVAVRVRGRLDEKALRASFAEVVARHESLRTTFPTVNGRPVQVVAPALDLEVERIDMEGLGPDDRELQARRLAREEARQPFNLTHGPLLRVKLVRFDADDHALLMTLHHIVADGWSVAVLVQELSVLYAADGSGEAAALAPLPIQYADFAAWQRDWLDGDVMSSQIDYWSQQLDGLPVLELPTDRPRPAVRTFRGARKVFELDEAVTQALRAVGEQQGATLFMSLLAGFQLLLGRYSGQEDVAVGSPVAGRNRAEIEGLIGFFVNTMVLRADLSGAPTVRELVNRVREVCLGAFSHQDLPFEKLVDAIDPERDLSRESLFQVMFTLQNIPLPRATLPGGVSFSPLEYDPGTAKFDLTLGIEESGDRLRGVFEFNTDLFDASTIERMIANYRTLLRAMVADPERRISELPVLARQERQQLLVEWNETSVVRDPSSPVHELFEEQARREPARTALVFDESTMSYGELNRRADALAGELFRRGMGVEKKVALLLGRSPEAVVAIVAAMKTGAAYVPIDPDYPQERIRYMIDDCGATVVLTVEALRDRLPQTEAQVVLVDAGDHELLDQGQPMRAEVTPADLAYVIYTSGSTGRPKGVMVPHSGLSNLVAWHRDAYDVRRDDRASLVAAPAFDASVWELWPYLSAGASLHIPPESARTSPQDLVAWLVEREITVTFLPTPLAEAVIESSWPAAPALRALLTGGDKLHHAPPVGTPFRMTNQYGPTENSVVATWTPVDSVTGSEEQVTPPIGRPIDNVRIYLLDAAMNPVPIGAAGELCIGGASLARGYLDRPALTAERFVPDPFGSEPGARLYRTGDLCRYRADGNLEFLGRIDHQVKVRGFRIELGEVEAVLTEQPRVGEAVAAVREDERGDRRLVAYLVAEPGETIEIGALRAGLQTKLPDYMLPSTFVMLDALPLTAHGKVDRDALPAPEGDRPDLAEAYVAPRDEVERKLAEVWAQVLGLDRVGVRDNFFALGGDSILAIRAINAARQAGLHLLPQQAFQHQTIAELARVVDTRVVEAEQGIVEGPVPLTPIQRWFFEADPVDPHHFNQSVLVEVPRRLDAGLLEQAVGHLLSHHDALRMRFVRGDDGWQAFNAPADPQQAARAVTTYDLSDLDRGARRERLEQTAAELQTGLDLEDGPLIRVAWFDYGPHASGRLLVIAHHLAVDGVSWRLLVEDLLSVSLQLESDLPVSLPPKTTSFRAWAERLAGHSASDELRAELDFWLDESRRGAMPLPVDRVVGQSPVSSRRSITVSFTADETRSLMRQAGHGRRWRIEEMLLTGVARAIAGWSGQPRLLIDVEGHGREPLFDDVDLSRTVGWFTTIHPLYLDLSQAQGDVDCLERVSGRLRAAPRKGIGYGLLRFGAEEPEIRRSLEGLPAAEVAFNYLGQAGTARKTLMPAGRAKESTGPQASPRGACRYPLEITAAVAEGELHVKWWYSEQRHDRETIEGVVGHFRSTVATLLHEVPKVDAPAADADLESTASVDPTVHLVPLRVEGTRRPLFCIHQAQGFALSYLPLVRHLADDQPVYGVQAAGLAGDEPALESVGEMARRYVDAVLTVDPVGPYRLAGHSFGGHVAFEMARLLSARGKQVEMLAMIDTAAVGFQELERKDLEERDDARYLAWLGGTVERFTGVELGIREEDLRKLSEEEQLEHFMGCVARAREGAGGEDPGDSRLLLEGVLAGGAEMLEGVLRVSKANGRAIIDYLPQPWNGRIALFRSEDGVPGQPKVEGADPTMGWDVLALDGTDIDDVPGDHQSIIAEPHVQELARKLQDRLNRQHEKDRHPARSK